MRKTVFATFGLALLSTCGVGIGQSILSDGDFEDLDFGTAPNCDLPNGAWRFPEDYVRSELCEMVPENLAVIPTARFDPHGHGHCLQLQATNTPTSKNIHLPNRFVRIVEATGQIIDVDFDIWIPEFGVSGGAVYLSGDHGGGGFDREYDRGPQIAWSSDGTVSWTDRDSNHNYLVDFAVGRWQRTHIEINLSADTWSVDYGNAGESLVRVGSDLPFRAELTGRIDHVDRFTYAVFGSFDSTYHGYIDNVSVSTHFTDFGLVVDSPCPLGGDFQISWTKGTPGGRIAVVKSDQLGGYVVPEGVPCAGTNLALSSTGIKLLAIERSDMNGEGSKRARSMSNLVCRDYLQLIDLERCITSNVAPLN